MSTPWRDSFEAARSPYDARVALGLPRLIAPVYGSSTFANLPSAATAGAGARAFVTDAGPPGTFGSTASGGGSNKLPVVSDGTNWLIG